VTSVPSFVLLERQQIHQRLVADDHAGRMDAGVAREIFQDQRRVNQFARDFLVLVSLLEFRRLLERLFQRPSSGRTGIIFASRSQSP
jgi:hypothetical protein